MNHELADKIYEEFWAIKDKHPTTHEYRVLIINWVIKYHENVVEFKHVLKRLSNDYVCIPDGKLNINCASLCSECHLYVYKRLINKINFPYVR